MNICSKDNTSFYLEFHCYVEVLEVEICMKISVEVDEKFKLAATSFQFGNLMKFTMPVFHFLGQYIQGFYETTNAISLLTLLSRTVSILLHHWNGCSVLLWA